MTDHAREKSDLLDRVPQGSIPQVLVRLKLVSELSLCEDGCWGRCRVCPADVVREAIELLTALRSLPPVPMQEVLAHLQTLYELLSEAWAGHAITTSPEYNHCDTAPCDWCVETKQHLYAALRSLASQNSENTEK